MKLTYTSKNGRMRFELDAVDPKDLFAQRAIVEMHDEESCGLCKCTDIRCEVRRTKDGQYTFYEMRCQNAQCGARLEFGQSKDAKNLFVKRSNHPETRGWFIYQGEGEGDGDDDRQVSATHPPQATSPPPTPPDPLTANVQKALDAMGHSQNLANLDGWAKWARELAGLTSPLRAQLEKGYASNKDRLARSPRK